MQGLRRCPNGAAARCPAPWLQTGAAWATGIDKKARTACASLTEVSRGTSPVSHTVSLPLLPQQIVSPRFRTRDALVFTLMYGRRPTELQKSKSRKRKQNKNTNLGLDFGTLTLMRARGTYTTERKNKSRRGLPDFHRCL